MLRGCVGGLFAGCQAGSVRGGITTYPWPLCVQVLLDAIRGQEDLRGAQWANGPLPTVVCAPLFPALLAPSLPRTHHTPAKVPKGSTVMDDRP